MRLPALLCAAVLTGPQIVPLCAQAILPPRGLESSPTVGPRIRPMDGRVAELLASGRRRSPRLAALVDRVERGDVIVYVGMTPWLDKSLAGGVLFAGDGGSFRYLRAMINTNLSSTEIIAALAHELYHVVEVIEHREVRSAAALADLYRRIGRRSRTAGGAGWETDAARQVTLDVRRDLALGTAAVLARRGVVETAGGTNRRSRPLESVPGERSRAAGIR